MAESVLASRTHCEAFERLSDICDRRPAARRVTADADVATTYLALLAAIGDPAG